MTEKFVDILRITGAVVSRQRVDRSNTNCLSASLVEVGATLGTGNPVFNAKRFGRVIGETESGTTPPSQLLSVVQRGAETLDMKVSGIIVNPSFLEYCEVAHEMESLIRRVTGVQQITQPHIRIMAKQSGGIWHTHAETDTGSIKRQQRIKDLENNGWGNAMVIEFQRK